MWAVFIFQDGRFSVLQTGGAVGWCVSPQTGETLQNASQSAAGELACKHTRSLCCLWWVHGRSVNPVLPSGPSWCELQGLDCRPDGSFAPLQCDVTSCWCVSEDGQEVAGTRTLRRTGRTPSCDREFEPPSGWWRNCSSSPGFWLVQMFAPFL